jgi:hypothetical protein
MPSKDINRAEYERRVAERDAKNAKARARRLTAGDVAELADGLESFMAAADEILNRPRWASFLSDLVYRTSEAARDEIRCGVCNIDSRASAYSDSQGYAHTSADCAGADVYEALIGWCGDGFYELDEGAALGILARLHVELKRIACDALDWTGDGEPFELVRELDRVTTKPELAALYRARETEFQHPDVRVAARAAQRRAERAATA